jgi:nucleotide exchange factor SIL1
VLVDLEYHLSDIDMTRDFYTLGGWPLLLSLMSAEVHVSSNQTELVMPDDLLAKVHVIQAHAAWAIGTAVKNTGEFIPYAVEEILIGNHVTTAVDLMLAQFAAASQEHIQSAPVVKKLQKVVYALGSLLRNNRPAQVHFCASGGPSLLGTTLTGLIEEGSSHANKMTKRLLMLADDIVSEVKLIEEENKSPQVDEAIMQAFSTKQWCQLAALALHGDPTIYETALLTVATLAGQCSWNKDLVQKAIFQIRDDWKAESDTDPDILKERLQLIESTMTLLTTEHTKQSLYSADY